MQFIKIQSYNVHGNGACPAIFSLVSLWPYSWNWSGAPVAVVAAGWICSFGEHAELFNQKNLGAGLKITNKFL